jgi:hypothetical protein
LRFGPPDAARAVAARARVGSWALSTVAAHELYHYLNNEHDHHNGRLNQEVMTPEGLVQGSSYDVMTASSGEEALALHGITPRGSTF